MVTLSSLFKKLCPKDDVEREWIGRTRLTRFTRDPETNSKFAPENGWLEYDRFLLGWPTFRGYVSFREGTMYKKLESANNHPHGEEHHIFSWAIYFRDLFCRFFSSQIGGEMVVS